jgi:DNA-binding Lrp family transcriptional regulator
MSIDETDRQVIDALVEDGRADDREIAEMTGIVANSVADRRAALEDAGVITGYSARIDYEQLGYDVTAVFQLAVDGDGLSEVIARLDDRDDLRAVYEVTGDHDVIAIGTYPDTDAMNSRIKDLLTDASIRSVSTSVVLNTVKASNPRRLSE